MTATLSHEDVLSFWFDEIQPSQWWSVDASFDQALAARFGHLLACAAQGELFGWRETPLGRLAEVIVLDQFSRNIHRGTPGAFAQDPMALALAQEAVASGMLSALNEPMERAFLLMPSMPSASPSSNCHPTRLTSTRSSSCGRRSRRRRHT